MPKLKQFDETAVLEKATNLFWEKGYFATSIQDLVCHLGINRASIYSTYGNKKDLFLATLNHYQAANRIGIQQMLGAEEDVLAGLRKLLNFAVKDALEGEHCKGCFMVNTTTELLPHDEEIRAVVHHNQIQFEEVIAAYINQGIEKGQIPTNKNPQVLSQILFTFINGIRVVSKIEADKGQLENMIETTLLLFE